MQTAVYDRCCDKSAKKFAVGVTVNVDDGNQATGLNYNLAPGGVQTDFVLAGKVFYDSNLVRPCSASYQKKRDNPK